jgi:hypothetical protein
MIHTLGIYPIGSLVELNTGERGIVVALHHDQRLKPLVRLLAHHLGQPPSTAKVIDLAVDDELHPSRCIQHILDPAIEGVDVASYLDL